MRPMKIYWFETVNPRKVCSLAKHLGVDAEYEYVDLRKGAHKQADFLGINPNGRVPALVDGEMRLWESAAICVYLAGSKRSSLWPLDDARAQAEILKSISFHVAHMMPSFGPYYFEHYVKPLIGLGAPDDAKLATLAPQFHAAAKVLDSLLDGRTHLACNRLTIADFIVGALLPDWKDQAMPLGDYRNIRRWLDETLMPIEAFRDPWPRSVV
jgi:glutathione S-transferase